MQDIVTIVGNVATDPTQGRTAGGVPVTNFRLASSHRRFDDATQTWVEVATNWYSVAAFRGLAENVKTSLRAGDSVIVVGRLKIRAWENNGKQGTSVDIDADAIGHDLKWGTANYRRTPRASNDEGARRGGGEAMSDAADDTPSAHDPATDGSERDGDALDVYVAWADPALSSRRDDSARTQEAEGVGAPR
ncbi:single-stranded DNA-binding protein [Microbacterium sp. GCS4]|uniref:single-stranded DNA-binding protein n=1 Tax=Microbacterium sp. GCS4 TaxID=1692239 RepID=UPI0009E659DA|nr:single-stranded DNA-binding protein [Microbacterium sp. GCS4]